MNSSSFSNRPHSQGSSSPDVPLDSPQTALFPLVDSGAFAEPWRRIAAAALDTTLLFLFMGMIAILGMSFGLSLEPDRPIFWIAPVMCWGYTWVGWSSGATLGMRCLKIKIVTAEDGKMDWKRAFVRILGYFLATFPLKLGLLPILTHPQRQGWHDQIARTYVINSYHQLNSPFSGDDSLETVKITPIEWTDLKRYWWCAPLIYTAIALVYTYPLILHFSTQIPGGRGDNCQFLWNYWLFSYSIANHLPINHTDLLFWPHTASLTFHTMDWFNCAIAWLLIPKLGLIATYNTLLIMSLVLDTCAAYFLIAGVLKDHVIALVMAPLFGFSAQMMMRVNGHINLISAEFLPIFGLFLYASLTERRYRYVLPAGIALGLSGWCDVQFLLFSTILAMGLWIAFWHGDIRLVWRERLQELTMISAIFVIGGVITSPLVIPMILASHGNSYMNRSGELDILSADLGGFFQPNPLSTTFRCFPLLLHPIVRLGFWENTMSVCVAGIVFTVIAFRNRNRLTAIWGLAFLFSLVIACGRSLLVFGASPKLFLTQIIFGFPGNGFALPWDIQYYWTYLIEALSDPKSILYASQKINLPFVLISKISIMKAFRGPSRSIPVLMLCIAVLASLGVKTSTERLRRRYGKNASTLAMVVIAVSVLVDLMTAPFPTYQLSSSKFWSTLGSQPEKFAVINIPLAPIESQEYDQTFSHKPMFDGFLARESPDLLTTLHTNLFLGYCGEQERSDVNSQPTDADFAVPNNTAPEQLHKSLQSLREIGARYVVVYKQDCTSPEQVEEMLGDKMKLTVVWDDPMIRAYVIK